MTATLSCEAVLPPARALREREVEHAQRERAHDRALLGEGQERAGHEEAALGVLPAHERLGGDHGAGPHVDERLVVEHDLAVADGVGQRGHQLQALAGEVVGGLHVGLVAAARLLRLVHRDVGALHQRLGRRPVRGEVRDADAGVDAQVDVEDVERLAQRVAEARGDVLGGGGVVEHDGELVAAEAGDVAGAHARPRGAGRPGGGAGRRRDGRACR